MERWKILLVDDAQTVLMMEKLILDRPEFELSTACDGEQALACARNESFDLILLDLVMPNLGGIEVCEQLRADPRTAKTPIIVVSTRGESEWVEHARRAGCSDYVTKPFDAGDLLATVQRALRPGESPHAR